MGSRAQLEFSQGFLRLGRKSSVWLQRDGFCKIRFRGFLLEVVLSHPEVIKEFGILDIGVQAAEKAGRFTIIGAPISDLSENPRKRRIVRKILA